MSATFAAIDAATIAALNAGEERALEQIFRSHYDVLLERAVEKLKDEPGAAPRLVLATVRELWTEREALKTSAAIEEFLNEELAHRARAIRSRMAAVHRFEKSEHVSDEAKHAHAPSTADQIWTELAATLKMKESDHVTSAARRREHAAHGAAAHIAKVSAPRSKKTSIIVGSIAALALVAAGWWANQASKTVAVTEMLEALDATTVRTQPGQLASVPLADSSVVRLGSDTRMVIVKRFGRAYRALAVFGSASIKVSPGKDMPLEVRLGENAIVASAGEFSVRAFDDEPRAYVMAASDGIQLTTSEGTRTLAAGQVVALPRDSALRDATADEAGTAFAWLDGNLVLKDVTVLEAAGQLKRWFAMDITVVDSAPMTRRLSISVPLTSSKGAIAAIEGGGGVKFAFEGRKMTFKDAAPRKR